MTEPSTSTSAAPHARAEAFGGRRCPACRSARLRRAFEVGAARFLRCGDCGGLYDDNPPSAARQRALYEGSAYFVKDGSGDEDRALLWGYPDDYLADRELVEAKFDRVLGHLERYVPPGRLLDVGAGPGFMLAAAERRGWRASGLDLNPWAVAYGRDELALDLREGTLGEVELEGASFDALTMMDVLEHITDPDPLVAEAARVVRPGGAIAVLTPDAGSPLARLLGRRWPEVRRPGEHTVLYSVAGLAALLARHGFSAQGWHTIGKRTSLATLAADVAPVAPGAVGALRDWIARRSLGRRVVDFDPRTKLVLYARRLPNAARVPRHRPARIPKRPERLTAVDEAILEELERLGDARRYCDWLFEGFGHRVRGAVAEVGAGIGTFSERIVAAGAERVLAIEPDPRCAAVLEARFASDPRVRTARESLPEAPSLAGGGFDLVVCQNVLEHIGDDEAALGAMAAALGPGGTLALLVPAGARLFGPLDDAYGHWRRYEAAELEAIVAAAGLEVEELRPVNALGIPAWWVKNRRPGARIGAGSLSAFEAVLPAWRALERRLAPRRGLSLLCLARRPGAQPEGDGSARR